MPYQIQHYCTVGPVPARDELSLCVCLLLQYLLQSCSRGVGEIVDDICYERRRAEACAEDTKVCVCFITAGPITKLCAWGVVDSGGHVL